MYIHVRFIYMHDGPEFRYVSQFIETGAKHIIHMLDKTKTLSKARNKKVHFVVIQ